MNRVIRSVVALTLAVMLAVGSPTRADEPTGRDLILALQDTFADTIARVEPSLVSVVRHRELQAGDLFLRDPDQRPALPLDRLIGGRIDPSWNNPNDPNYVPTDFGSGVIIDASGLILTNYHVIDGADLVRVVLHDGRGLKATVWAADPRSDLAVLRVAATKLEPIRIGDARKVKKGHIVLALGNPFATAQDGRASASWGIISNIARRLPPPGQNEIPTLHQSGTLLQTDARLNIGTSGGALVNVNGEMIGLVTSLAAIRGYDQAAGYAIPLDDTMLRILAVLREGREVEYGFLGVRPDDVHPDDTPAEAGALEPSTGARVIESYVGSPAFQAGIQPGDIITAVDGTPVRNREELILTVGTRFAGSRVPFAVLRNRKRITVPVVLGKFPVEGKVIASVQPPPWRGLRVDYPSVLLRNLYTGQERLQRVPDGGALVAEVEPGSAAAESGLRADAIVTHVNNIRVRTPNEFRQAAEKLHGKVELTTDEGKFTVKE